MDCPVAICDAAAPVYPLIDGLGSEGDTGATRPCWTPAPIGRAIYTGDLPYDTDKADPTLNAHILRCVSFAFLFLGREQIPMNSTSQESSKSLFGGAFQMLIPNSAQDARYAISIQSCAGCIQYWLMGNEFTDNPNPDGRGVTRN